MTSPIAVDIVVNNHNYGAYVCEAVDSACRQGHPAVNIVVVDDGSTDDSRDRLRSYQGTVELVLKDNAGQASAFNAGFDRCRGDAVMLLDADDVLAPDAASRAAAALAAEPTASRVQFRMAVIDADGNQLGAVRPPLHVPLPGGDLRRAELSFPFDMAWVGGGNAFRASALRRIMPIPERAYGRWGADWYLVHLTTLLGQVVALEEIGAFYRLHGRNAFEPAAPTLDLERIRREISYQQATICALAELADELRLQRPEEILSLSNVGLRIISLRLAPELHPVIGDRVAKLLLDAVRAAGRRYDVSILMRALIGALFAGIAVSPATVAERLAELFFFPERRERLTPLIRRLRRTGA